MFYSHEILTSRRGGVATVWLVATLGSKSNLKKVNRKAILDVHVPETCRIIITPEVPMALRLQGNLLYGVSRVFSQQCGYILSDAQLAQANMRALLKAVNTSEVDLNAGKARPDQLVLQDDPAFLPDFGLPGLDIDLSALDISTDDSPRRSSILSPHSQRSSLSSQQEADESMLGLIIPTSDTGGPEEIGGFILPGENVSSAQRSERPARLLEEEDEGFNPNPGFTFDADGNLIEERTPGPGAAPAGPVRLSSHSAASAQVRQELMEGFQAGQYASDPTDLERDVPKFQDDSVVLPSAEPFPAMAAHGSFLHKSSSEANRESVSESAEAPLPRKPRVPKQLPVDQRQELHNADLAQWKADYAENMAKAAEAKKNHKAPALAKRNAGFWVMGKGIGGVGTGLGTSKLESPLAMFAGNPMMEALTGTKTSTARVKRSRESEESHDSDSEARRVRMRDDDGDQIGRGNNVVFQDDDGTMMIDTAEAVEAGRHAQPPLEDPSLPWNISSALGSRQASLMRGPGFASSIGGFPTSAAGPSSVPGMGPVGPSSLDRRGSRITSASPLRGRGPQRYSSLEFPIADDNGELLGDRPVLDDQALDEFQLYGPGAVVSTQTAADSQWVRSTLNQEASNFLAFVESQIGALPGPEDEDGDELTGPIRPKTSVTFEELLPLQQNTKIVAAQALYHVLALATKTLLHVKQDPADGPIDLSLPTFL